MISVKISKGHNLDRLMSGKMLKDLENGFDPTMVKIGKSIKTRTKYYLNGRVLQRRTSNLYRSIDFVVKKIPHGFITFIGSINPSIIYARIHEEGGRAGRGGSAKIPKRPYLRRALVDKKKMVRSQVKKWVRKSIRG